MNVPKSENISRVQLQVTRAQREGALGQRGVTVWFTGLSASGKSTIATRVDQLLTERGRHCYVLDGDNIRFGLNRDLGFSPEDRNENIRRIGEVAKLFGDAGTISLSSFISPYKGDRDEVRALHEAANLKFVEVFVDCPLATAEERDPKGLYKKARAGEIKNFTGIDDPYEAPENPEIHLRTDQMSLEDEVALVIEYLLEHDIIREKYLTRESDKDQDASAAA